MRAIPSPTSSTRPTSWTTAPSLPASLISFRRTETISSGLNFMTATLDQLIADLVQSLTDACVVLPVVDPDDQPAQDVRIDPLVHHGLLAGELAHLPGEPLALLLAQGDGTRDVHVDLSCPLLDEFAVDCEQGAED